eukprot:Em0024g137a
MKVATEIGFAPPVLVEASPLTVNNEDLERKVSNTVTMAPTGDFKFCSATYRIFKIDVAKERSCEHVEQVSYKGTIPDHEDCFQFAYNISISVCQPTVMSSSMASLLKRSRYAPHFTFQQVDTPPEGPVPSAVGLYYC